MMLSPAHKKFLVLGLLISASIGVLYAGIGLYATMQVDQSLSTVPATIEMTEEVTDVLPTETAMLYLSSGPESEQLFLDSRGKKIAAITLRFELERSSIASPMSFKLDPALAESGWQVAINDATEGNTVFELALINSLPSGGMIFTADSPVGSFQNSKELSLALDPTVSMAIPPEGAQLELEFIRQD